jgi:dienelactone hydrolase
MENSSGLSGVLKRIAQTFGDRMTSQAQAASPIEALVQRLGEGATFKLFPDADHSFHVPARTGRKDADVRAEMLNDLSGWVQAVLELR